MGWLSKARHLRPLGLAVCTAMRCRVTPLGVVMWPKRWGGVVSLRLGGVMQLIRIDGISGRDVLSLATHTAHAHARSGARPPCTCLIYSPSEALTSQCPWAKGGIWLEARFAWSIEGSGTEYITGTGCDARSLWGGRVLRLILLGWRFTHWRRRERLGGMSWGGIAAG